MKLSKPLSLQLAWILLALFMAMPSGTASTSSYYLDASRLELQVSPTTDTASGVVKVSSNSTRTVRLKVIPKLWHLNELGVLTYDEKPPGGGYNLLENIGVNPQEFDLLPGKSRLVRFIVKTPHEVKDAEFPFQLYFQPTNLLEPQAQNQPARSNVSNMLDVVPIFTTTVYAYKGNPAPAVKVDQFQCGYLPDKNAYSVTLGLGNTGDKHARLFGNIILNRKNASGQTELMEVLHMQNSTLIIVFPGGHRTVQNELAPKNKKTASGDYQMELRLVDERNVQPAIQSSCNFTVN